MGPLSPSMQELLRNFDESLCVLRMVLVCNLKIGFAYTLSSVFSMYAFVHYRKQNLFWVQKLQASRDLAMKGDAYVKFEKIGVCETGFFSKSKTQLCFVTQLKSHAWHQQGHTNRQIKTRLKRKWHNWFPCQTHWIQTSGSFLFSLLHAYVWAAESLLLKQIGSAGD